MATFTWTKHLNGTQVFTCSCGTFTHYIYNYDSNYYGESWTRQQKQSINLAWMAHHKLCHPSEEKRYAQRQSSSSETDSASWSPNGGSWTSRLAERATAAGEALWASPARVRGWFGSLRRPLTWLSGIYVSNRQWIASCRAVLSRRAVRGTSKAYRSPVVIWPECFVCSRCGRGWDYDAFLGPTGMAEGSVRFRHTCADLDDGLYANYWER